MGILAFLRSNYYHYQIKWVLSLKFSHEHIWSYMKGMSEVKHFYWVHLFVYPAEALYFSIGKRHGKRLYHYKQQNGKLLAGNPAPEYSVWKSHFALNTCWFTREFWNAKGNAHSSCFEFRLGQCTVESIEGLFTYNVCACIDINVCVKFWHDINYEISSFLCLISPNIHSLLSICVITGTMLNLSVDGNANVLCEQALTVHSSNLLTNIVVSQ